MTSSPRRATTATKTTTKPTTTTTTTTTATPPPSYHPAAQLLSRAHSPTTATDLFTSKIKHKPLLLQPTAADSRALRRHLRAHRQEYHRRHRRPPPLTAKEKRESNIFTLRPEEIKYDIYAGLHRLWVAYMLEILGYTRDGTVVAGAEGKTTHVVAQGGVLASADFHGAELEVVRCQDAGRVGVKGIVVRETRFAFVLVTPADRVRVVPKRGAVFRYAVPLPGAEGREAVFELHGSLFEYRPAERANRKFKWRVMDYL